jgi:ABC-type ATPase with predicted acetyltransferase domain
MRMSDAVKCSVGAGLEIVRAGRKEYEQLSPFHYRDCNLGPYAAVYALKDMHPAALRTGMIAGVIVYTTPAPNLEMRKIAIGDVFSGFSDRRIGLAVVNKNIRCISRVIIEPRYRGIGLASMLVRKTLKRLDVPIIEAMAVMGRVNPFFEKAGMKAYFSRSSLGSVRLAEAFSAVGIEDDEFIDAQAVHERMCGLAVGQKKFLEIQMQKFLQSYGKRKYMPHGVERMRYVLSKLTYRPVYYIWRNPDKQIQIGG